MSAVAGLPGRLLLLASLGALALGGGVRTGVAAAAALACFVPAPPLPGAAWLGGHAGVLCVAAVLAGQGHIEEGMAVLVAWLAVHRRWTGRTQSDARIGVLFATLLVLLGALASAEIALGLCLAAWVALLPMTLLHIELGRPGGGRALAVGAGTVALTGALYVILPRLQGGYLAGAAGGTVVPDTVTLGDDFGDTSDQAVVARVRVHDRAGRVVAGPFHIRGRALDTFDGTRWVSSFAPTPPPPTDPAAADRVAEMEVEAMEGGVLFGIPEVVAVRGLTGGARRDENGTWFLRGPPARLRYTAYARTEPLADAMTLSDDQEIAYLKVPPLPRRITELALSIAPQEADPRRLALAMSDWLSANIVWVESPPAPVGDPLVDFLFERRTGHCEYFASALAMMLRMRGVPARLVTGFWSGEMDTDGQTLIVRRGQAHAWVEVPLASGWTTFDPSPLAGLPTLPPDTLAAFLARMVDRWNRWVVEYNFDRQVDALADLGRAGAEATGGPAPALPAWNGLGWVVGGVTGAYLLAVVAQLFAGRILIPRRGSAPDPLQALVHDARRLALRRGWGIPAALPPLAAAEWLVAEAGPSAEPFRALVWVCYEARYGGRAEGALARARELRSELDQLRPAGHGPPAATPRTAPTGSTRTGP